MTALLDDRAFLRLITAVNGICGGGGLHWVADTDIVIAASDPQFFDPHVNGIAGAC